MKKYFLFLCLLIPGVAAEAQSSAFDITSFKSVTVNGIENQNKKRMIENGLPVCGYYSPSDSIFYSCNRDHYWKIKDPNSLKDGKDCCESITFDEINGLRQNFTLFGTLEMVDSVKKVLRLKNGETTYFVQFDKPGELGSMTQAMGNKSQSVSIRIKSF